MEFDSPSEVSQQKPSETIEVAPEANASANVVEVLHESTIRRLADGAKHLISQVDKTVAQGIKSRSIDL